MDSEEDFSIAPVLRQRTQHSPAAAPAIFSVGPMLRLHVKEAVLSEIRNHAASHSSEEVGGVLLGRHYESEQGFVVVVHDHVAVPSESKSGLHFDFDESSIEAIFNGTEKNDEYVVGWYHSHTDGPPFMSGADHRLHSDHFPLPWYVSCVVAAGEWGLPLEFWHLLDGELTMLDEYAVEMAAGMSASYSHQRYLRACQMSEASPSPSASGVVGLLPSLGLPVDGELGRALGQAGRSDLTPPTRISELRLLTGLAGVLQGNPGAKAELDVLADRLAAAQSFEGVLARVLVSDQQRDSLAVCRPHGIAVSYGDSSLSWFDLVRRIVWPVAVTMPVFAASFSADGSVWLLGTGSQVLKLTHSVDDISTFSTPVFETTTFRAREFEGNPMQIAAGPAAAWIRTTTNLYWIPTADEGNGKLEGLAWDLPAADAYVLLDGLAGAVQPHPLLTQHGRQLCLWSADELDVKRVVRRKLPEPWAGWRLTHACSGSTGLFLLFDDGEQGQVGLFDRRTLEPICHYVDDEGSVLPIADLCADPLGRVYVRCGSVLYLLRP